MRRKISPEEGNQYLANADAFDMGTARSFNALTREVAGVPRTGLRMKRMEKAVFITVIPTTPDMIMSV